MRTLLTGLIDYAGLYPPAKLPMQGAVESYARSRAGDLEWMLGRFVCPASRLEELSSLAAPLMPGTNATSGYREYADLAPWQIAVVIDGTLDQGLAAITEFNRRHAEEDGGMAVADVIELKAESGAQIDDVLDTVPADIYPFFEIPVHADCRGMVAALSGAGAAAKIRTGGITADAFPTPAQVAAFTAACSAADVPFKATAGLHHPLRGEYPLTYEPACPRGMMHGFLNLFLAAALVRLRRADESAAASLLESRTPGDFHFTDEGVRYRDRFIETTELARVRETFALSYGSCSFDEPVADLRKLTWL
jgi:hypothetical protein